MKYSFTLLGLSTLCANTLAAPHPAAHVLHESRDYLPASWSRKDGHLRTDDRLPMRIGLTQSNLEKGHQMLMDVSSPYSSNYGKHYSKEEVAEVFAPSNETVEAVKTWLKEAGIDEARISTSQGRNWLKFEASVAEVEELLRTKYSVYEHESGAKHIGCDSYHVPKHIQDHVDFILPTVHIDARIGNRGGMKKHKRDGVEGDVYPHKFGGTGPTPIAKAGHAVPDLSTMLKGATARTDLCNQIIFPECLQALYNIPSHNHLVPGNSYGIVEYTTQAYQQTDLDLFNSVFLPEAAGSRPDFKSIDGGDQIFSNNSTGFDINGESDLDLQYASSLVFPQPVTLYQVGDFPNAVNNSFNNFIDGIDGSYCTFEGGDDPAFDAVYPDTQPGGYMKHDCGVYEPTKVISTSYGYNEADLTPKYAKRQCDEYMKLGMQGVTVVYSSGDNGVGGNGGQCLDNNNMPSDDGTKFNPGFPSSCPYVTSIGATQIVPGASVTQPEEACQTVISSGGGFSNLFPVPDYQSQPVKKYLSDPATKPQYNETLFNNSGTTRGFPDMAANGANYAIILDGTPQTIFGTSASAPTVGSIFTLINGERLEHGKSVIGFVNPTLYAHPDMFNDITNGTNAGCGTDGFKSAAGWDPVTGLGTPDYIKMKKVFLKL